MSEQAFNTEVQRLQCLQALGITVYHPRFRLPGARPSEQGAWTGFAPVTGLPPPAGHAPLRTEEQQAVPPSRPAAVDPARPSAVVRTRVIVDTAPELPVPSAAPPKAARASDVPRDLAPNFQLLFLQVDADLALVNQIPALARPQLHDRQLVLLTNLLRWLGKSVPAEAPRIFRWPLPGLEQMAASMSAGTSLLHFLEQACSERRFRYLLQLGPQAVAAPAQAWQSFATHSLDEMLALPSLKREAWQALLPLHALLQAKT